MAEAKFLSREDILQTKDITTEEVKVSEWGGVVRVKGLNGTQRNAYEQSMVQQNGKNVKMNMQNATAKLVALTVVDENDKPLFEQSDVEALGQKSGSALNRIFEVAQRLSGLSDEDMDDLTGN